MDGGSIPPSSTVNQKYSRSRSPAARRGVEKTAMIAALLVGGLVSCGNEASAPTSCPVDEIVPTIATYVPDALFIDTAWNPMPNTDLAAALTAGGVACSYGIQEAEVGATLLWATGAEVFASRQPQWQADGQQRVDIDGTQAAWILQEINGAERHVWAINMLVADVWIQINATFLPDLAAADNIIAAAIAVVVG